MTKETKQLDLFEGSERLLECSKCGEYKPCSEFHKDNKTKRGYVYSCKVCVKQYKKQWREDNPEHIRQYNEDNAKQIKEYHKQYREDNAEYLKQQKKQYYEKNSEQINKKQKQYNEKNAEQIKLRKKQWREDNAEHIKQKKKQWYEDNPEYNKQYNKQYYEKNSEQIKRKTKQWQKDNAEQIKLRKKQYREDNTEHIKEYRTSPYKSNDTTQALEEIKRYEPYMIDENGDVNFKCTYCGIFYKTTRQEVYNRLGAINGTGAGEQRFYCSDQCKQECPTYRQQWHEKDHKTATSREVQPQLRQMVLKRDNYTCQKCKKHKDKLSVGLHCHHIWPLNESPITSADIDECITYCKDCHVEVHKTVPGCGYAEMKCSVDHNEDCII